MNLAQKFGLEVESKDELRLLLQYMSVKMGEKVREGDVIAEKKGWFFGLFGVKVTSPIDGVIDSLSEITGQLMIRKPPLPVEVSAYIPGTVVEVIPNEGVVIQSRAALVQGIFGVGGETEGILKMVAQTPDQPLTAEQITADCKDKIVVGGGLITASAIQKATEVGVAGLVAGGVIDQDLIEYLGYDIGVAITGQEDLPFTLIVTEGFGDVGMADKTFKLLTQLDGAVASLNGATQIRAGVMRPEIIVVHDDTLDVGETIEEDNALTTGTPIRIIRNPYFGQLAKVTSLPPELVEIETGAKVRILTAKIDDTGEEVTVARANVELIQG